MPTNYSDSGWVPFQVGSIGRPDDEEQTDRPGRGSGADRGSAQVTNIRAGNATVGRQYDGDVDGPIHIRF
ncbi:hypothetical protein [Micromonospora sp. NPDC023956]|uniref:hypothetical protein n=1 Tax=Micromonospora sp. NPDC023956 TaxID=3155722 RepID=UPI0033F22794